MTHGAWGEHRVRLMVLLAFTTSLGPLALNVYLPSLPAVQHQFSADLASIELTVSLPILAFGLGLLLLGPLSDRFGRRPPLLWGLALFVAGTALAAAAPALWLLGLARMIAAVGTSLTFVASRAVVADLSAPEELQRSVAQTTMIMLGGQMVAPVLGNGMLALGGWKLIQLSLCMLGVVLWFVVRGGLAETHGGQLARHGHARAGVFAPTLSLARRPRFVLLAVQVGIVYSGYPAFIAIAPHLMIEAFGRPASAYSYYYPLLPLGYFAGNWLVLHLAQRMGPHRLVLLGAGLIMVSALVPVFLLSGGLWHPLALFLPAGALLNVGIGLGLPSASARAVRESYPTTASGWGVVGFGQQLVAALSVQALGFFSSASPYPVLWLCVALGAATLALELLPAIHSRAHAHGS